VLSQHRFKASTGNFVVVEGFDLRAAAATAGRQDA